MTLICSAFAQNGPDLNVAAQWKYINVEFPSEKERATAVNTGNYNPKTSLPFDVDVDYANPSRTRIFVTIPRVLAGVAVTLGTVSPVVGADGPQIRPYPDYSWHVNVGKSCDGLVSVYRIAVSMKILIYA